MFLFFKPLALAAFCLVKTRKCKRSMSPESHLSPTWQQVQTWRCPSCPFLLYREIWSFANWAVTIIFPGASRVRTSLNAAQSFVSARHRFQSSWAGVALLLIANTGLVIKKNLFNLERGGAGRWRAGKERCMVLNTSELVVNPSQNLDVWHFSVCGPPSGSVINSTCPPLSFPSAWWRRPAWNSLHSDPGVPLLKSLEPDQEKSHWAFVSSKCPHHLFNELKYQFLFKH